MATMRAVDVKQGKGPAPASALFINDKIEKPVIKPAECLIKTKAFGLNRADTLQRMGFYPVPAGHSPIMGLEFSGIIEEVGSEAASEWKKGDEVMGLVYGGGYAEYIAANKKMLVRKPKELSWEECAGAPEVWMTALQAIHLVGEWSPTKVKSILWHAGASAVSIAGIQLSKNLSPAPKVYATARQHSKCDFVVNTVGAQAAINTTKTYNKPDGSPGGSWSDEVKRVNGGEGVDLVIDFIGGGSYFGENLNLLARDGRIVMLGLLGGAVLPEGTNIAPLLMKRASIVGSTLRSRDLEYQGKVRDLFVEKALPKLVSGEYKTPVEVMSWKEIEKAHTMLEQNKTMGKLVCVVD